MKPFLIALVCAIAGAAAGTAIGEHMALKHEVRRLNLDVAMHAQAISELQSKLLPKTDFRPKPPTLAALP